MTRNINIRTKSRTEFIDITGHIQKMVEDTNTESGICCVYIPHTTASVTINEGADPSVVRDVQSVLSRLIPHNLDYAHLEGNSDAHIKSTLVGPSIQLLIEGKRLVLGTWQAVFFCEFDGPRHRRAIVKILGEQS